MALLILIVPPFGSCRSTRWMLLIDVFYEEVLDLGSVAALRFEEDATPQLVAGCFYHQHHHGLLCLVFFLSKTG